MVSGLPSAERGGYSFMTTTTYPIDVAPQVDLAPQVDVALAENLVRAGHGRFAGDDTILL